MSEFVPQFVTLSKYSTNSSNNLLVSSNSNRGPAEDDYGFNYSFINREFIDDLQTDTVAAKSFRNISSTPLKSTPTSLPKSLPIDWKLFNSQFVLNTKLKHRQRKASLLQYDEDVNGDKIKNNFENLPFEIIEFIISCVSKQTDLINLSRTCKFFNKFINKNRLYNNILIIDNISSKNLNYYSNFILLDIKNYSKFLATLHSNKTLLSYINKIIINTSSESKSYDELNMNYFDSLYDLFLTNNNNLNYFLNLDLNNLKKFDSLINYNINHLIKYKYNLDSSLNLNSNLLNLKNFQLLDLNDINNLPISTVSLSILITNEFNFNSNFKLTRNFNILSNLISLQLNTSNTFELFLNEMLLKKIKLDNLKKLSISNIHQITHNKNNYLNFNKINSVIDLNKLTEFEIKFKCQSYEFCNHCLINFFNNWCATSQTIALEKFSLINLSQSLNPSLYQFEKLFNNENFLKFLSSVNYLFIKLIDFPFVPIFTKNLNLINNNNNDINKTIKFPISKEILKIRKSMYSNILNNFKNLNDLIILDFFHNWFIYNKIKDLNDDNNLNYLSFLNSCNCGECRESRLIFKNCNNQMTFRDYKQRFVTDESIRFQTNNTSNQFNHLTENPDDFRIFFNFIIRELRSRIPIKQLNQIQTSLDLKNFPTNKINKSNLISNNEFNKIIKLIIHSIDSEIEEILLNFPKIRRLNLGGIQFHVYTLSDSSKQIHALHDDFTKIYKLSSYL